MVAVVTVSQSQVNRQAKINIPAMVRDMFNLKSGDLFEIETDRDERGKLIQLRKIEVR